MDKGSHSGATGSPSGKSESKMETVETVKVAGARLETGRVVRC